jgi:hypothetical protein
MALKGGGHDGGCRHSRGNLADGATWALGQNLFEVFRCQAWRRSCQPVNPQSPAHLTWGVWCAKWNAAGGFGAKGCANPNRQRCEGKEMSSEDKYIQGMDLSRLPPQARQVIIAVGQFDSGEPITQKCPSCDHVLVVKAKRSVWFVSCNCGLCNDTLKGI